MQNVIKTIKFETFEGEFNGMVTINLANEVDGNIITDYGAFSIGKTNRIRVHVKYIMYVLRNVGVHGPAISTWLNSLKAIAVPLRQAAWTLAIQGQEIDVEPVLREADEEHSEQWYSHTINSINVSEPVLNAAYGVMARILEPTLTVVEAREMGKLYRAAAEAE